MVESVRRGCSQREVARRFGIPVSTIQHWLKRARGKRLDRVDWSTALPVPHRTTRTSREVEERILELRRQLRQDSVLGEYGAKAIHSEIKNGGAQDVPSVRTIGRVLRRRGVLDGQRRVRRPAPPRGWYLDDVARGEAELDSFDVVQGLVIEGGTDVEVLNAVSLHGRLVASWPLAAVTARVSVEKLTEHWREWGLPGYAQFDNDTRFQGAHQHKDSFGRVMRLCLALQVVPVFAPPREHGFQASVESFNGLWQAKVWARCHHKGLAQLQERSACYVDAHRARTEDKRDCAPPRRDFPRPWSLNLQGPLRGRVIFLRRADQLGKVFLLGRKFTVSALWTHRLIRCEVDLNDGEIRFFTLRRAQPFQCDLLKTVPYVPPRRRFTE